LSFERRYFSQPLVPPTIRNVKIQDLISALLCGASVGEVAEAPLPKSDKVLQWDAKLGVRVRK
jgi:hypothetical protein